MSNEKRPLIRGAGGKDGGGSGGLSESPDTLRSTAYAQILDLISEGEIEGFPTTSTDPSVLLQYVYFDGTPVANADGTLNFRGAKFDFRPGTQGQTHIDGFKDSESEIVVGVEVKNISPVVRTITDATVDAARVTLRVNSFYTLKSDGSMKGADVEYKIEVQSNGGGYVLAVHRHIKGKSSGQYERAHWIPLAKMGAAPWDIRVTRVTQDNDADTTIQDAVYWDSYTQIVEAKFRFPNSALAAIKIDSSQFGHIPSRGYDLKLLRVQVPSNYDPTTRAYTGAWDGTFKIAWTDNPAWVYYDMVTNDRYGLGKYITAAEVNKWALYAIGQYCDVLVDDGFGGQEPRFTCNAYFQKRQDAYTFLQNLASVFRGMAYWGGGQLSAVQDAPSDPVALFTNANVIEGRFTYSGSSRRARHTVALVQWNNPANLYKSEMEYVPDRTGIARYGVVQTEVVAVGCTSRGQAHRVGKWLLYSERQETEICAWRTGLEGIKCRPGQIVEVADQHRAGTRRGGRIKAATTSQITLDDNVTIDPAYTYTLSVIGPGGVVASGNLQLPAQAETTNVITLQAALASAPSAGAIWLLSGTDVAATTWRVVGVTEPDKNVYEVTAVAHDPNKYAEIEQNIILESAPTTTLNDTPAAPAALALTQHAHSSGSAVSLSIGASWTPVVGAKGYLVAYQIDGGNVIHLHATDAPHIDIPVSEVGTYGVTVKAVSMVDRRSAPIYASAYYDGTSIITLAQPVLTAVSTADGIDLSWAAIANADSYLLERSNDGATGWTAIGDKSKALSQRDPLVNGEKRYYRVTAYDHFGATSSPSAVVNATAKTVENGATVGADWGVNLGGRPVELTDGRILTALNSAGRLNGQLNNVPLVAAGNYTAYWSTPPSFSFSGSSGNWTVTASQGVVRIGSQNVTIDGWSITGLPDATTYYAAVVLASWPSSNHVTSPQVVYSTNQKNVNNNDTYLPEGNFTTPSSGGTGGGGGGFNCVTTRMWLGPDRLAKYAQHGWRVAVADGFQEVGDGLIDDVIFTTEPCVRLTLDNGWFWEGTPATPWDLQDGSQTTAGAMKGQTVLLKGGATAVVSAVEDIGLQQVARIQRGGLSFAAGDAPDHLIYSHNGLKP